MFTFKQFVELCLQSYYDMKLKIRQKLETQKNR